MSWARNVHTWVGGWLKHRMARAWAQPSPGLRHLLFAFCDHHEPLWGGAGLDQGLARVRGWVEGYPVLAKGFRDADGLPPRHSFFFPGDQYRPKLVNGLSPLVRQGVRLQARFATPASARTVCFTGSGEGKRSRI